MTETEIKDDDGGEPLDLDAWEPQAPPTDFAERVLARVRAEEPKRTAAKRNRRWAVVGGGAGVLALAAAMLLRVGPPAQGEAIAKDRVEVAIGNRALAVLEPGAQVRWNGDDVVQPQGDVFYRVERGARFTVHTPAGDVEVKGTCFTVKVRPAAEETNMMKRDVKAGTIGAALSALAFVAVYEGKVAVSHASEHVDLGAGETAQAGPNGVKRTGSAIEGDKAFAASLQAAADEGNDPTATANKNLVRQVSEYRSRLEAITAQKGELETKLKKSEERLAAAQDGAPASALKSDFDLSPDDWKELAKDGTIKYAMPCLRKEPWTPSPDKLKSLGLAPQDAAPIHDAYTASNKRVWATVKPLCAKAVGNADVAEKIGPDTCIFLVLDMEKEKNSAAVDEARKAVGEIRAGLRPMPGPNDPINPVEQMFLAITGESKAFESDLAQSLGPEEAHRLTYDSEMCMHQSTFGGTPKK